MRLCEEEIAEEYCRYHTREVGTKAAYNGVAVLLDAYGAEVYCENVEGCVGRTLQHAGKVADEGVGAEGGETFEHHAARSRTAKRLHEGHGKCSHEVGICSAHVAHEPAHAILKHRECAAGLENAYGSKYGNAIGYQADGNVETALSAFDEGIIYVEALAETAI